MATITADAPPAARPPVSLSTVIWVLGLTQIVSIGSIFYSFAMLVPGVSGEFGTTAPDLFLALAFGLAASGLTSPFIGRFVDRFGAPTVMVIGSLVTAATFVALGLSPNTTVYWWLIVLLQAVTVAVLPNAAMPAVAQFGGQGAQRGISFLMAMMGLSSSVFFPLIGFWLLPQFGWRGSYFAFAAMHLFIALPCHLWLLGRLPHTPPVSKPKEAPAEVEVVVEAAEAPVEIDDRELPHRDRRFGFWAVAISLALTGAIAQAIAFQIVLLLEQGVGLEAQLAIMVAFLLGPTQVIMRLGQAILFSNIRPLPIGIFTGIAITGSMLLLLIGLPPLVAAIAFATVYGLAQGLNAIVSGTLPLELFGRNGYGELLGRMAVIRVLLSAASPFLLSWIWFHFGLPVALYAFIAMGVVAVVPLIMLGARLKAIRARARPV